MAAQQQVAAVKEHQIKQGQALHEARLQERLLLSSIASAKAQAANLRHKECTQAEQVNQAAAIKSMAQYLFKTPWHSLLVLCCHARGELL